MSSKFQVIQTEERYTIRRPVEVNGVSSEMKCIGVLNTERGTYKVNCQITTKHTDRNNAEVTKASFALKSLMEQEMTAFLMQRVADLNFENEDSSQMSLGFEDGDGGADDEAQDGYPAPENRRTLTQVAEHYEETDSKEIFKKRKSA